MQGRQVMFVTASTCNTFLPALSASWPMKPYWLCVTATTASNSLFSVVQHESPAA